MTEQIWFEDFTPGKVLTSPSRTIAPTVATACRMPTTPSIQPAPPSPTPTPKTVGRVDSDMNTPSSVSSIRAQFLAFSSCLTTRYNSPTITRPMPAVSATSTGTADSSCSVVTPSTA